MKPAFLKEFFKFHVFNIYVLFDECPHPFSFSKKLKLGLSINFFCDFKYSKFLAVSQFFFSNMERQIWFGFHLSNSRSLYHEVNKHCKQSKNIVSQNTLLQILF